MIVGADCASLIDFRVLFFPRRPLLFLLSSACLFIQFGCLLLVLFSCWWVVVVAAVVLTQKEHTLRSIHTHRTDRLSVLPKHGRTCMLFFSDFLSLSSPFLPFLSLLLLSFLLFLFPYSTVVNRGHKRTQALFLFFFFCAHFCCQTLSSSLVKNTVTHFEMSFDSLSSLSPSFCFLNRSLFSPHSLTHTYFF